jgi:hypothetical protein
VLLLARIRPALSPADAVPALLQSLIDKFKGLREGLEVQQRALAGKAVKADARTTVAVPEGAQRANPDGKGTTSANAVVIEDEEARSSNRCSKSQRSVRRIVSCMVSRVAVKLAFSTAGTRYFVPSRAIPMPCTSASAPRKSRMLG